MQIAGRAGADCIAALACDVKRSGSVTKKKDSPSVKRDSPPGPKRKKRRVREDLTKRAEWFTKRTGKR